MSRQIVLATAMLLGLTLTAARDLEAQRNCVRGIPCGNTCIAANRTCRTGTPPSRPAPEPNTRTTTAAPPPTSTQAAEDAPRNYAPTPVTEARAAQGLTVPGVPGYVALDSIELLEVQAARLRAFERRGGASVAAAALTARDSPVATAAAAQAATRGPWVASSRGSVYYRTGCSGGNGLAAQNRIYFETETEAQAAGYRRSSARGC